MGVHMPTLPMPIEASQKGGSLPSSAESPGAAPPLRRLCRNSKTASHIRKSWHAHGISVFRAHAPRCLMCTPRSALTLPDPRSRSASKDPARC